jgi:hypothetical protein
MQLPPDWLDTDDPLESRAFHELMMAYRHSPVGAEEFEDVKRFLRYYVERWA